MSGEFTFSYHNQIMSLHLLYNLCEKYITPFLSQPSPSTVILHLFPSQFTLNQMFSTVFPKSGLLTSVGNFDTPQPLLGVFFLSMFYVILIGIGDCYEHLCIILWFKKKHKIYFITLCNSRQVPAVISVSHSLLIYFFHRVNKPSLL